MFFLASLIKPLAYISVPIVVLRGIASSSTIGRYYVNVGIYLGTMVAVAAWGAVVGVAMLIARRPFDLNYYIANSFYAAASRLLDIKIEVEGGEHLKTCPALLMSNHQSMLDVLIVGRVLPPRATIMAKKELMWSPLGPFMLLAGALFVDRGNSGSAIKSLADAGEAMKKRGTSLWIFPEGTRSSSEASTMLPFKKGGFHIAVQAGIPIVPIVTENYWWLYHSGVFRSGTLKIRVLSPIPTTDLTTADVPLLATRVHDQMLDALREISVKGRLKKYGSPSQSIPLASVPAVSPPISTPDNPDHPTSGRNRESIGDTPSDASVSGRKTDGSETGTETEEDEGMVLVGHPVP